MNTLPSGKNFIENLTIHQASELLGVATKTLRRWEDQGILVPNRTEGGHRRYSRTQVMDFKKNRKNIKKEQKILAKYAELKPVVAAKSVAAATKPVSQPAQILSKPKQAAPARNFVPDSVPSVTPTLTATPTSVSKLVSVSRLVVDAEPIATVAQLRSEFRPPAAPAPTITRVEPFATYAPHIDSQQNPSLIKDFPQIYKSLHTEQKNVVNRVLLVTLLVLIGAFFIKAWSLSDEVAQAYFPDSAVTRVLDKPAQMIAQVFPGLAPAKPRQIALTDRSSFGKVLGASTIFDNLAFKLNVPAIFTKDLSIAGVIQGIDKKPLIIGGNTTGAITLIPSNGAANAVTNNKGNMNLVGNFAYEINGVPILTGNSLGATIINSSLTSVGALSKGSIVSGFGPITTNNTITGTVINATTSINTGGGNGTVRIDASGNLININNITASGTITGGNIIDNGTLQVAGAVTLSNLTTGIVHSNGGLLSSSPVKLDSADVSGILPSANGGTGADLSAAAAGSVPYFSATGVMSAVPPGSAGLCFTSNGSTSPTWANCSGLAGNLWTDSNGLIYATNTTQDFAIGGTASASAKFAVLNVSQGTPTASVSAGTAGGTYMTADGTVATTAMQSLTLGNGTTGNVIFGQAGNVGIGTNSPTGLFSVGAGSGFQVNGSGAIAATTGYTQQSGNFAISGGGTFSTGTGAVSLNGNTTVNGTTTLNGNTTITGTNTLAIAALNTQYGVLYTNGAGGVVGQTGQGPVGTVLHGNDGSGAPSFSAVSLTADVSNILPIANGGTNTNATPINGGVAYGSGGAYAFSAAGTGGFCLTSGGSGAPVWQNCATASANVWASGNGAIFPQSSTMDLLVGGQSTASAKFAFINNNSGTPTASIAGSVAGNALSMNGDGVITTSLNRSLALNPNGGNVGVGTSTPAGLFSVGASSQFQVDANGAITAANSGNTINGLIINAGALSGITGFNQTSGSFSTGPGPISLNGNTTVTGSNTFSIASLNQAGGVIYANGTGQLLNNGAGTSGFCLNSGGSGAPFWASCSGAAGNQWNLANGVIFPYNATVDLVMGGVSTASAKFAVLNMNGNGTPTASVSAGTGSAGGAFLTAAGNLQTTNNQALTLGGGSTGNIVFNPLGGAGSTTFNGSVVVPNLNNAGGVVYTTGTGQLADSVTGTSGFCLLSGASGAPTWANCNGASGSLWNQASGAIFPQNGTVDLLVGGQSTASAKFAFINVSSGTPTASIAGTVANVDTYLTGNGNLATTNMQTLTLGGATTGGINVLNNSGSAFTTFDEVNGRVGIGTTTPSAPLNVSGTAVIGGTTNYADNPGFGISSFYYQLFLGNASSDNPASATGMTLGTGSFGNNPMIKFKGSSGTGYVGVVTGGGPLLFGTTTNTPDAFWTNNAERVRIDAAGNVGIATTTPTAKLDVAGAASVSGSLTFRAGAGSIQTTTNSDLTIGGNTTGAITLSPLNGAGKLIFNNLTSNPFGVLYTDSTGLVSQTAQGAAHTLLHGNGAGAATFSQIDLTADVTGLLPIANGGTNSNSVPAAGAISYGTGSAYAFNTPGTSGQCLISGGSGSPTWGGCGGNAGAVWNSANGALFPANSTEDLFVGGQSTASAKFSVLNVNSGTPVASISAGTAGGGFSFTATGSAQTTNRQTMVFGGATTGNIQFNNINNTPFALFDTTNNRFGLGTTTPAAKLDIQGSEITTGNGISGAFNGLTTGAALNITSTSTALTTGQLGLFDWSPGSATTATGDLFSLNVGANGTIGNIFNVKNNGSSVFAISQNQVTDALPTQFTAAGDVSMGYDLQFTNPTASFIKSAAPLYVQSGDTFGSSDLTLRTFNSGSVVLDSPGGVMLNQAQAWTLATSTSALNFGSGLLNLDSTNNRIGINSATPVAGLDLRLGSVTTTPIASLSGSTTFAGTVVDQSGTGDIFTASKSGATKFTVNNAGNVLINNLNTAGGIVYNDANGTLLNNGAGTSGFCLTSGGAGAPTWQTCAAGAANTLFTSSSGAIYPLNSTEDLLVGGQSTASAKFAFINVNSGTPTASIAGSVAGNALSMNGDGTISTTLNRSLALNPNGGNVGIGTSSPTAPLDVSGNIRSTGNIFFNDISTHYLYWQDTNTSISNTSSNGLNFSSYGGGSTTTYRFHSGNVNVSSSLLQFSAMDAGVVNTVVASSINSLFLNRGTNTITGALTFNTSNAAASPTERMRIDNLGNVGIGNTAPLARLDVKGAGSGTLPVASMSGATTFANTILDQSGSGDIFTASVSGATKFVIKNSGNVGIGNGNNLPSAVLDVNNSLITTTDGIAGAFNGLTTGNALHITSTSTALTTGGLGVFDWSPGSATTATGDLFSLNVGANGTIGNILNVKNNGSSVFSVGQNQITAALPTQFTSAGDVSMGYDLQFTNPTSSFIKSLAPLYVQSGDTFGSSDLTLRTFNSGNIVLDAGGGVTLNQAQAWTLATGTSALNFGSGLLNLDTTNNRIGINSATPIAALDTRLGSSTTTPVASFSGQTTSASMVVDQSGLGDIFTASVSGATKFVITNAGNVGVGTTSPRSSLEVAAQGTILGSANGLQSAPTSTNTNLILYKNSSTNWSGIGNDTGGAMYFTTGLSGSASHMALSTSGNLTLGQAGVNNDVSNLEIRGTNGVAAVGSMANMIQLSRPNNGTIFQESVSLAVGRYLNDGGFNPYTRLDFNLNDTNNTGVANNTIMSLLGNGNIGIGNTAPLARLDVKGAGSGTQPVASMSGATTFANTIIDQSGSGDIFTASVSGATKFVITNAGNVGIGNGNTQPSAVLDVNNSLITTTNGISGTFNGLTTGAALNITSTSTALTTGQLGKFDWSPGSATTATGDLFSLNVGANGTIGNIFNVKNNGSSVFSVGQNQITAALPTQFTAAGDIMAGYDLQFVNPTSSFIKSNAPLYIQSGETFNSSDLTLRTFNSGNIVLDAAGGVTLAQTQNWALATGTSALNIGSNLLNLDSTNNRIGINVATPIAALDTRLTNSTTVPVASFSGQTTSASMVVDQSGTGDILTASVSGATKFVITNAGNVGIGNSIPSTNLDVTGSASVSANLTMGNGGTIRDAFGNLSLAYKSGANTWATGVTVQDTTGNVGIGTTSPSNIFHVFGGNTVTRMKIESTGSQLSGISLLTGGSVTPWNIDNRGTFDTPNNRLMFSTGSNTPLTLLPSGFVGVNTIGNPGASLDVGGSGGVFSTSPKDLLRLENTDATATNNASNMSFFANRTGAIQTPTASISGILTDNGGTTYTGALAFSTAGTAAVPTERMRINGSGNVGIGTTSPAFRLDITDTQAATVSAMITNSNTGTDADGLAIKLGFTGTGTAPSGNPAVGNRWLTMMDGNGDIQGAIQSNGASGTTFATNGIDLAEYFVKDDPNANIPVGTMVCQGTNGVRACQTGDTGNIIGIVSAHPAFLGGSSGPNKVIVALSGQVPLRVSSEHGDILSGDPLGISSQNGVASKPIKAGQVGARALTTYFSSDPNAQGEIMVNVGQSWYDPDVQLHSGDLAQFSLQQLIASPSAALQTPVGQFVLNTPVGGVLDRVITASDALIANVQVGSLNAKSINTDALSIKNVPIDQYIAQIFANMSTMATSSASVATSSATPTSASIAALSAPLASSSAQTQIQVLTSTASAIAIEQSFSNIQLSATDAKIAVAAIQADQYVDIRGSAYVGNVLGVQQGIVIGNGLSLTDAGNGTLSVLNGLLTLNANGGAIINGDLTVNGRIATTDKDAGGFAVIKQGDTAVTVTFARPYTAEPVITATADDAALKFGVRGRTTNGFTIYLTAPAAQDEQLSWVALAVGGANGAQTTTSQGMVLGSSSATASATATSSSALTSTSSAQIATPSATLP